MYQRTTLARAFGTLPDRWQTFLWLSFVEGADRGEIATILGVNVGGVSALGYRAREGLRRAYLDAHLVGAPTRGCAEVWPMLSGAVRGGLTPSQRKRVDEHVGVCEYCRCAMAELDSVNSKLGVLLAPLVLGAAAPAYLDVLGQAHGAGAAAGSLGYGSVEAGTVAKASILGFVKGGAASLAVVASTSTVALVAMIAVFTAPLGSEPSADAGPDQVTSDVARDVGSQPTARRLGQLRRHDGTQRHRGGRHQPRRADLAGDGYRWPADGDDRPHGRPDHHRRPDLDRPAHRPAHHVPDRSPHADRRPDQWADRGAHGRRTYSHRRADPHPERRPVAHELPDRRPDLVGTDTDPGAAGPVGGRGGPARRPYPHPSARGPGPADERRGPCRPSAVARRT